MQAESIPQPVSRPPDGKLRLRIRVPNTTHMGTALCRRELVGHAEALGVLGSIEEQDLARQDNRCARPQRSMMAQASALPEVSPVSSNNSASVPDWDLEQLEVILAAPNSWQLVVAGLGAGKSAVACRPVA